MKFIKLCFILFFVCSCATIRFTKSSGGDSAVYKEQLHHIGLLGLYEYSDPVSPKKICGGGESSYVETEYNLITGAINYIPLSISSAFLNPFFPPSPVLIIAGTIFQAFGIIYTPMSVKVACQGP